MRCPLNRAAHRRSLLSQRLDFLPACPQKGNRRKSKFHPARDQQNRAFSGVLTRSLQKNFRRALRFSK
jgi:hypothetical protein